MTQDVDLRSSVESIDTENVLLPLLERLGIDIPRCLTSTDDSKANAQTRRRLDNTNDGIVSDDSRNDSDDGRNDSDDSDDDEEVIYIVDRFGCVVIDDDDSTEEGIKGDEDWRITSTTSRQVGVSAPSKPPSTTRYFHKMPEAQRQALAMDVYRKYNALIFDNALPSDMHVSWNKKLTSTAGLTHYKRAVDHHQVTAVYTCRIELATKVLDTSCKLERTLIHEMCHCAAWLIDHVAKPPHGKVFKKYAMRAMTIVPDIDVSTCHNYQIFYPHRWQCGTCYQEYGRHSKSIDVEKKVCGACRGRLVYLGRFVRSQDGTVSPAKARSPTKNVSSYSTYVKTHFHRVKQRMEFEVRMNDAEAAWRRRQVTVSASDVMKALAAEWASSGRL